MLGKVNEYPEKIFAYVYSYIEYNFIPSIKGLFTTDIMPKSTQPAGENPLDFVVKDLNFTHAKWFLLASL